jgi:endonuclease/exonuclease/phosphatase family metal-dependent hydrolase
MRWLPFLITAACGLPSPTPEDFGDDDDTPTVPDEPQQVRIATWNVEALGYPGSEEYEAVAKILARIDADIIGINEIDAPEVGHIKTLGTDLGYTHVTVPSTNPFGDIRNAILTRLPVLDSAIHKPPELSGDAGANDVTRYPVSVTVDAGRPLTVVVQHWKSGFDDDDEFRRAVDSLRTAQAAESASDWVVAMGDVNQDVGEPPWSPARFTDIPAGMPSGYQLGNDLTAALTGDGIANDAFEALSAVGLEIIEAQQLDGRYATRDISDRRIDYILGTEAVRATAAGEVYDSRDESSDGLSKSGEAPPRETSANASDHFPVLVDFTVH